MIVGIDEVGLGALCGPVYAAAVLLAPEHPIEGLADSKKLKPSERERLDIEIRTNALAYAIGVASVEEIDELNVLKANHLAMSRALASLGSEIDLRVATVIVDGCNIPDFGNLVAPMRIKAIVKADAKYPAVSAASIIAKVARDNLMNDLALEYPGYGFEKHKGYGTPEHYAAIREKGLCAIHRKTFQIQTALPL